MADARFRDLCLDGVDARTLSEFWAAVLGRTIAPERPGDPDVMLRTASGERSGLTWINEVPERHEVKSRVHLDLRMPVDDPAALVELGATVLRAPDGTIQWWVMS